MLMDRLWRNGGWVMANGEAGRLDLPAGVVDRWWMLMLTLTGLTAT